VRKQPPWWPDGAPATHLKALVGWKQVARLYAVAHKTIFGSTALLDALEQAMVPATGTDSEDVVAARNRSMASLFRPFRDGLLRQKHMSPESASQSSTRSFLAFLMGRAGTPSDEPINNLGFSFTEPPAPHRAHEAHACLRGVRLELHPLQSQGVARRTSWTRCKAKLDGSTKVHLRKKDGGGARQLLQHAW
jgi:hypothetical protein